MNGLIVDHIEWDVRIGKLLPNFKKCWKWQIHLVDPIFGDYISCLICVALLLQKPKNSIEGFPAKRITSVFIQQKYFNRISLGIYKLFLSLKMCILHYYTECSRNQKIENNWWWHPVVQLDIVHYVHILEMLGQYWLESD